MLSGSRGTGGRLTIRRSKPCPAIDQDSLATLKKVKPVTDKSLDMLIGDPDEAASLRDLADCSRLVTFLATSVDARQQGYGDVLMSLLTKTCGSEAFGLSSGNEMAVVSPVSARC